MARLSNRVRSALALLLGGLVAAPSLVMAGPDEPDLPSGALILFGANWCAPCLAELRNLSDYADAMAPAPILLAWTDGKPPSLWRQWPGNARLLSPDAAAAMLGRFGGRTAGLPYVALLDAQGALCADLRGKLSADRLEAMKAQCRTAKRVSTSG